MSDIKNGLFEQAWFGRSFNRGEKIPFWIPILLGTLTAVGPVSTDIYLPALPEMEQQLGASAGTGSLTMAAWVAGLAIGQIIVGPLTDRFGRRRPLLVGTLCYALAAAGCALATNMPMLCIFRALAAFMGAASLVVPNACIRDLTMGDATAKLMSRLILIQGVVPILAPALGGFALQYISWRDIFWATSLYGVVGFLLVLLFLPESLALEGRQHLRLWPIIVRYGQTLKDTHYRYNALVWMVQGFVIFTYLTAAPFLFESVYHFTPFHYGMLFGVMAICMIGSSQLNAYLLRYFRSATLLKAGLTVSCVGSCILLGLAIWSAMDADAAGHLKHIYLWPLFAAMVCALGPGGCIGPNAMAAALQTQGHNAGVATALAGTGQYVAGIVASVMFSWLPVGTAIPMGAMLFVAFVFMAVFARLSP